jgi:hypothetical protein
MGARYASDCSRFGLGDIVHDGGLQQQFIDIGLGSGRSLLPENG